MLFRDILQSSPDPPDEWAPLMPLIGRGAVPPLPVDFALRIAALTSSVLEDQLDGLESGKRGGVREPDESPDEPKPKSGRGGVNVPLLPPPFRLPFIGPIIHGRWNPCSNMASETGSGTRGIPIIP
jgi:hypothetical protein